MNADSIYGIGNPAGYAFLAAGAILAILAAVRLAMVLAGKAKAKGGKGLAAVFGILGVVAIAGGFVVSHLATKVYPNSMNALFTRTASADTNVTTTREDWLNLAYEIADEGMVLLKNDDNVLPLAAGTRVNLLGYHGWNPVYSGSGSGNVVSTDSLSFVAALEGAGFSVNTAPLDTGFYSIEKAQEGVGFMGASFTIDEPDPAGLTGEASFEQMKAYSDVAIVVIGRSGGEAADLTKFEQTEGRHYLELSVAEEELLKKSCETFGTVIVVYNGANALEMGFVERYNVDAVIWAGIPGPNGLKGFADILSGAVNPSGKLPDTYAYDVNSAPVSENFGEQKASNADEYYVDYVENIYVGYKWYETAYAEGATITNTKTGDTYNFADFESVVQYPFGFGLSYTTFEQKIVSVSTNTIEPNGDITVTVEVKNTGSVAGKDAVQLYFTSPYTDYDRQNGVEKAAVQLLTFDKTKLLEPGESQTIELTFSSEDLASYDMSHANADGTTGAYMLDAGDYVLSLRSDSHTVIETTTVSLSTQYFFEGNNKRPSDVVAASNRIGFAARGIYLSRNGGFANYAEAMGSVVTTVDTSVFSDNYQHYDPALDEGITLTKGVDYDAEGELTLADLTGVPFDDPRWDALISQMSVKELKSLTECMYNTAEIRSIKKRNTQSTDGPLGISSMFSTGGDHIAYPCIPLLSATFNPELAYRFGACFADQAHTDGITTWYAPAMDIHRSPFSGRNFEYYSEDAVLSGTMAAREVLGAREKGLVATIKHFALNDQESQRSGMLHTYSNEQAAREIYFRPFEDAVKDGGATAIMNSMNYVGDRWIGVCSEIQQDIIRGEWGFRGSILTDMAEGAYCTGSGSAALRAGTDIWLTFNSVDISHKSDADIYYLQRAAKNILFVEANATTVEAEILPWQPIVRNVMIGLCLAGVAGIAAAASRIIPSGKDEKKAK